MQARCEKPEISTYNFLKYLCATLSSQGKIFIDSSEITSHIFHFKRLVSDEALFIFEDMEFRVGIDDQVISKDITEALNQMQTFGIIGKLYPSYNKIVIRLTPEETNTLLQNCDEEVAEVMAELAKTF